MKVRRALAAKLKYREYIEDGRVVQYRESMRLRQRERHLDPKIRLIARAKSRARAKKVECTLNPGDLIIPDTCPVLGTPFVPKTEYAMSIDAIDPTKGYTPNNVQIISMKANAMKNSASQEELIKFAAWVLKEFSPVEVSE